MTLENYCDASAAATQTETNTFLVFLLIKEGTFFSLGKARNPLTLRDTCACPCTRMYVCFRVCFA